jgi:hypothetical protein
LGDRLVVPRVVDKVFVDNHEAQELYRGYRIFSNKHKWFGLFDVK